MNDFQKTAKEMLDFIEKSPTCFHAVANIGAMLEEAGYVRLRENEEWKLVKGGKYYTERNDSSVIAFAIPTETVKGFHMAAAHSDSPCFKVKEKPELTVEDHYMRLNTEKYFFALYIFSVSFFSSFNGITYEQYHSDCCRNNRRYH